MTRRRNPPPRRPGAGGRSPSKDKEQAEQDARLARATRKAENQKKQQLRRWDWEGAEDAEADGDDAMRFEEAEEEPTGDATDDDTAG